MVRRWRRVENQLGELTTIIGLGPPHPEGPRPANDYLLVFEDESSRVFQVPATGEVVLGRGEDATLRLLDVSVSRRHAAITRAENHTFVVDLESQNGTLVNGERIAVPRPLVSGDVVTVGSVTLIYHSSASPVVARGSLDLAQLRQRAADELERALVYQRPLTVAAIVLRESAVDRARVVEAVALELRRMDAVAWAADDTLMLVLPEIDSDEATARGESLLEAVEEVTPEAARIGVASCPVDGCDVDTLFAAARAAAVAAPPGAIEGVGRTVRTIEVGDRTVIVADPAMARLFQLVERLASSELPVLVCGETGTGKEIAAYALHQMSRRSDHPLVSVNCAATQDTLVESELFGYERGAFSGAVAAKPGLLEIASGGTVFLDEIGDLPAAAQAKLLRVLETKRLLRLGDVKERAIDIRIVAATNRDLSKEVAIGRFRQDLFFRLSGATLWIPPLRDRPRELPLLAQKFLRDACVQSGRVPMSLSASALRRLLAFPWPGNVRELRNVMEYLSAAVADSIVEPWHLDERIARSSESAPLAIEPEGTPPPAEPPLPNGEPMPMPTFRPLAEEIRELERTRIAAALAAANGNQRAAARMLAMPLRTFVFKLKHYGLRRTDEVRG
jgi:two-component system, NtrC family, response regulator AtoC